MYIIAFGFQHRTHTHLSSDPKILYSSAAFFVCYSLLHMRFDRIGFFLFHSSLLFKKFLCSQIPLFDRIQWDSNLFFLYSHIAKKSDKIVVLLLCMYFFLFKASSFLSTSVSKTVKRRIIENAAVLRRIRNTQYDGMYSYTCNLLKHPQPNALLNFQCRCMKMIGDK